MENSTNLSNRDWSKWCQEHDNVKMNGEEYLALRDAIMLDAHVANLFFTTRMKPLAQELRVMVYNRFHVFINVDDIAAIILYLFYQDGKWSRLRTYDAKCSIFSWIAKIARQRIFFEVVANGFVTPTSLTPTTTALTIKSMRHADERLAVVSLVEDRQCRMLLSLLYVRQLNDDVCMQMMKLDNEQYKKMRHKATRLLKTALIDKETMLWRRTCLDKNGNLTTQVVNLVSLALSDKTGQVPTVSNDDDDSDYIYDKTDESYSVYDCLDGMLPNQTANLPLEQQWTNFVVREAYFTPMGILQLQVWLRVYLRRQPYAEVARHLGISVTNAYNNYKNAKQKIAQRLNCWYQHAM